MEDKKNCNICYEEYLQCDIIYDFCPTSDKHIFCKICLHNWKRDCKRRCKDLECPICRTFIMKYNQITIDHLLKPVVKAPENGTYHKRVIDLYNEIYNKVQMEDPETNQVDALILSKMHKEHNRSLSLFFLTIQSKLIRFYNDKIDIYIKHTLSRLQKRLTIKKEIKDLVNSLEEKCKNIYEVCEYKNNLKEGSSFTYYMNHSDQLFKTEHYVNNKLHGEVKYFYKSNNLALRLHYTNGILDGPFEIYYDFPSAFYTNPLFIQGYYKSGSLNGTLWVYRKSGKIRSQIEFENNHLYGVSKLWTHNHIYFIDFHKSTYNGIYKKYHLYHKTLEKMKNWDKRMIQELFNHYQHFENYLEIFSFTSKTNYFLIQDEYYCKNSKIGLCQKYHDHTHKVLYQCYYNLNGKDFTKDFIFYDDYGNLLEKNRKEFYCKYGSTTKRIIVYYDKLTQHCTIYNDDLQNYIKIREYYVLSNNSQYYENIDYTKDYIFYDKNGNIYEENRADFFCKYGYKSKKVVEYYDKINHTCVRYYDQYYDQDYNKTCTKLCTKLCEYSYYHQKDDRKIDYTKSIVIYFNNGNPYIKYDIIENVGCVKFYHKDGTLYYIIDFHIDKIRNNVYEKYKIYYPNGVIKTYAEFMNNKINGKVIYYAPTGRKWIEASFINNKVNGDFYEYYITEYKDVNQIKNKSFNILQLDQFDQQDYIDKSIFTFMKSPFTFMKSTFMIEHIILMKYDMYNHTDEYLNYDNYVSFFNKDMTYICSQICSFTMNHSEKEDNHNLSHTPSSSIFLHSDYEEDLLYKHFQYKENKKHGPCYQYIFSQNKRVEDKIQYMLTYENDIIHGECKLYDYGDDGKIYVKESTMYKNGKKDGAYIKYKYVNGSSVMDVKMTYSNHQLINSEILSINIEK